MTAIPEKTSALTAEELAATILQVTGTVAVGSNPTTAVTVEDGATVSIETSQMDELRQALQDLVVEMRVLAGLFNEGMNTKANLEDVRHDVEDELNQ